MSKNVIPYDASNPEHVAEAKKDMEDRDKDILFVLGEQRGRRWLYDHIFSKCHVLSISHVPIDRDSTAFNEGARSVGLALDDTLRQRSPKLYMKMLEENHFND